MYTITVCRCGNIKCYYRVNRHHKGAFFKTFYTLSDMAKFINDNRRRLFYPSLKKELSPEEFKILGSKLHSLIS